MSADPPIPYVVGQWVAGTRFYGRQAELERLRSGSRQTHWVAGLRRIGKTSLLKQLEHLSESGTGELALFWDLQGVDSPQELYLSLADSLLDAEEALERHGIDLAKTAGDDLFSTLARLHQAVARRGLALRLLLDEVDALIPLVRQQPALARQLWEAMLDGGRCGVVLASSIRLQEIAATDPAVAGLVEPCGAPLFLGPLADREARSLLAQAQLPAAARPLLAAAVVEEIRAFCGNHPMLLQIAAKRYRASESGEPALAQMTLDRTVNHLFRIDFELLSDRERTLLLALAARRGDGHPDAEAGVEVVAGDSLGRLEALGLVRRSADRAPILAYPLLATWLERR